MLGARFHSPATRRRRRLLSFQVLESRRPLAVAGLHWPIAPPPATAATAALAPPTIAAEAEPDADLVQFAKDLTAAGVQLFQAGWDADSTAQARLFEDGRTALPAVEVTGPDRQLNEIGIAEGIEVLPTWKFPSGTTATGILSLETLSELSGVPIPMGARPVFRQIDAQTVTTESPLHLPVDAYDPNGEPLTIEVSVADPNLLSAAVLSGNRSIRIEVDGFGDMVFELFEQRAPRPAQRVIELAESGFYDDIIFHRVIENFMIQTGDPTGTGTSGSDLGSFDDQYHVELKHNRDGVISFAKSNDDTNNSQFFITAGPQRPLDFNHSVFGQLVEGDDVRKAIAGMQTVNPAANNDRPVVDIVMNSVTVFNDSENGLILLQALTDEPATTAVTVRVTDSSGLSYEQSFDVEIVPDTANSQPFLGPLDIPDQIYVNQTIVIDLPVIDVEGDPVVFNAGLLPGSMALAGGGLDAETQTLTLTPAVDTTGTIGVAVLVAPHPDVVGNLPTDFDRQDFVIEVVPPPPFHRWELPADVDGDGDTTALDALLVINAMFRSGGEIDLSGGETPELDPQFAYNVNGDSRITALDALQVINALALVTAPTSGEAAEPALPYGSALPLEPGVSAEAVQPVAAREPSSGGGQRQVHRVDPRWWWEIFLTAV